MKCKICEQFFVTETKFKNLFVFEDICSVCKETYEPSLKTEVFPLNLGLVKYSYLYEDLIVNYKIREYLMKNYDILFQALEYEDKKKIIIIIDDSTYFELEEEIEYISGFRSIIFVSIFRYSFDDFVKFY